MPSSRRYNLLKGFNITLEEYDDLQKKQRDVCAICFKPETIIHMGKARSLAVDHCHSTSKVRGLLCSRCNQALGLMRESVEIMLSALDYIRKHK